MRIDNDIEYKEYIEQMLKAEEELNGYELERAGCLSSAF